MAYMLRQRLTNKTSLEGTPTWRYKLPSLGRYTALELEINCNRYTERADNTVVYPLETQITKVELLEGASRALLSLTPTQLNASNYWDFRHIPPQKYDQRGDCDNKLCLFLLGGRDLYDKEFGFDFAKLDETYLEYTHALTADAAEKFDVSDHEISLYGWRWMGADAPSFRGYRRIRQLASWTTTGTGVLKTIPIPIGNPIRRIAFQATADDTTLGGTVSKVQLKVNDGEYSPVTITSVMSWLMQEVVEYNLNNEIQGLDWLFNSSAHEIPRWFSYWQNLQVNAYGTQESYYLPNRFVGLPARIACTGTAGQPAVFIGKGWGYQKCGRIGFDHVHDGFDLLQTRGMGSLDLELTEVTGKTATVFVEDLLTY